MQRREYILGRETDGDELQLTDQLGTISKKKHALSVADRRITAAFNKHISFAGALSI
jgi:hypothetical protein